MDIEDNEPSRQSSIAVNMVDVHKNSQLNSTTPTITTACPYQSVFKETSLNAMFNTANSITATFQTLTSIDDHFDVSNIENKSNNTTSNMENNVMKKDEVMSDSKMTENDDDNASLIAKEAVEVTKDHSANNSDVALSEPVQEIIQPSHHARRPMNAFLIFCKRHRAVVREKYPTLENRAVTKILGEWWAALDDGDKSPYIALAKQYKDAFFSANPDFKWYKLPAPPLRSLHPRPLGSLPPRPNSVQGFSGDSGGEFDHQKSPNHTLNQSQHLTASGFTPGKLADETQLGGLSSLIDPNYNSIFTNKWNGSHNNNNNNIPKPFKKRVLESVEKDEVLGPTPFENLRNHALSAVKAKKRYLKKYEQTSSDDADTSDDDDVDEHFEECRKKERNVTQQDLINRIVDHSMTEDSNQSGELIRKSGRSCKGKRYAEFMTEGRLGGNRKIKKGMFNKEHNPKKAKYEERSSLGYNIDLNCTIQRLTNRTKRPSESSSNMDQIESPPPTQSPRQRTVSETSDDSVTRKMFRAADFNLDEKIEALPSLSLEKFQQKKKDSKKRKKISHISKINMEAKRRNNIVQTSSIRNEIDEVQETNNNSLIGSRKRKARKESITHIDPAVITSTTTSVDTDNADLCNLATLAEVASILGNP